MTSTTLPVDISNIDQAVDVEIAQCLDLANPKSFFLFAGAGSGKTYSLVKAIEHIQNTSGAALGAKGQRVGVITYTNAAVDEIKRRIKFDPRIDVSTIHSFAWTLIAGLNHDIREWLREELGKKIDKDNADEEKGRKGSKVSRKRLHDIAINNTRLSNLDSVQQFTYNPAGENRGRDALNHAEVIQITADFLSLKSTMQSILVGRYPFLLIDESQDTNEYLIDALFVTQAANQKNFALGLIGDMMQRIYSDGKEGLDEDLPADWAKPVKKLNRRCPERIVELINKIRSAADTKTQQVMAERGKGHVAIFILRSNTPNKTETEHAIASKMATITGDIEWSKPQSYKCLVLEHHMAASRMGFLEIYSPLNKVDNFKNGLRDGKLPFIRFYTEQILPLVTAERAKDQFAVARMAKMHSPLLSEDSLKNAADQPRQLKLATSAIESLMTLWQSTPDPTLMDILRNVAASNLFPIPDQLRFYAEDTPAQEDVADDDTAQDDPLSERSIAIGEFLTAPFSQVETYAEYVSGNSQFSTHQGVKGLEFKRVMVIMDDNEAKGFSFKYESLFGAEGGSIEITRRLFYVTCSRAEQSLALVAYTNEPERVKRHVLDKGWFEENEIHCI